MNALALYKLRDARPEDAAAIIEVQHSAIQGVSGIYPQAVLDAWDPSPVSPEVLERRAARIASGERIAIVAGSESGEIAGYGSIKPAESELYAVYVSAGHGRRGIGRLILSRLEELASLAGLTELWLDASINAEPFYRANGYISEAPGEHVLPSGARIPCVRMRKRL